MLCTMIADEETSPVQTIQNLNRRPIMSLTAVRVDLFDDTGPIVLQPGQFLQFTFNRAGLDNNHWVMCSVAPIHSNVGNFTSVEIVRQWQNMQRDGSTDHQVIFHNIDTENAASFIPRFLV